MEISAMLDEEAPEIIALWQTCQLTRPWNDPEQDIRNAMNSPDATVLVGRHDGVLIASVMVGFDGHRGWLYYLSVHPDFRKRGYGRLMVKRSEEWLQSRNSPKMQLMVRKSNTAIISFYESLGLSQEDVVVLGKRFPNEDSEAQSARPNDQDSHVQSKDLTH